MSGAARRNALTTDLLMRGYAAGVFPMAESRKDRSLYWVEPRLRGILPLDGFHLSRRLARTVRNSPWRVTLDGDFRTTVALCAESAADRPDTWINETIEHLCGVLHDEGRAHSVEVWDGPRIVGGLYGVRLGGAFFGESMFSRARDASKIALVHLVARLRKGGFSLLDTQFVTAHLSQFGVTEVSRDTYQVLLREAIAQNARLDVGGKVLTGHDAVQWATQTS